MRKRQAWDFDCAVIGGGPGGLVSALYLRRFRRSVAIFSHGKPRAAWIPRTHNLLGFPHGISGPQLLRRLNRHLSRLGLERFPFEAKVRRLGGGFEILSEGGRVRARKVILATGFEDVQPPVPNLGPLREQGLLRYCPVCDAYDFRDRSLVVLAQDPRGIERALFLRHFTPKLKIIVPAAYQPGSASVAAVRRAGAGLLRADVLAMESVRSPRGLWIHLRGLATLRCDAAYIELGALIRDSAFRDLRGLTRTKDGYLIATTEQRTAIPGLFAVGDCVNLLGQISVAAGQAAVAATTVHDDLL